MRYPFPAYDETRSCASLGDGAKNLLWWAVNDFGRGAYNLGVCNCRTVAGKPTKSRHGPCAACDIGFPLVAGRANPAGWDLTRLVLPHAARLGIQLWIWDRWIWSASSPAGRTYTGVHPHRDHIHAELTDAAAGRLNVPTVRAAFTGHRPPPFRPPAKRPPARPAAPPPAPPIDDPEEDDMAVLVRLDMKKGSHPHAGRVEAVTAMHRRWVPGNELALFLDLGGKVVDCATQDAFNRWTSNKEPIGSNPLRGGL